MGSLIKNIIDYYNFVNDDLADSRTKNCLFCTSPVLILLIIFVYHRFVKSWGPAFMENRPAYNLKKLMIVYNVIQVYLSLLISYQCLFKLYFNGHYSVWCQKMNYEDNETERLVINYVWLYYVVKIVDLLDTVTGKNSNIYLICESLDGWMFVTGYSIFFVLRKKFTHVSFLHVYHHIGMCVLGYVGTKYVPGGHGTMLGCINSIVHAVMYSYYLISIVRPEWVRAWWKKYITQLQILQFLLLILHFGHVIFEPSCEYPKWVSFVFLPHNIFILFLFSDFYIKEYIYKKKNK